MKPHHAGWQTCAWEGLAGPLLVHLSRRLQQSFLEGGCIWQVAPVRQVCLQLGPAGRLHLHDTAAPWCHQACIAWLRRTVGILFQA